MCSPWRDLPYPLCGKGHRKIALGAPQSSPQPPGKSALVFWTSQWGRPCLCVRCICIALARPGWGRNTCYASWALDCTPNILCHLSIGCLGVFDGMVQKLSHGLPAAPSMGRGIIVHPGFTWVPGAGSDKAFPYLHWRLETTAASDLAGKEIMGETHACDNGNNPDTYTTVKSTSPCYLSSHIISLFGGNHY